LLGWNKSFKSWQQEKNKCFYFLCFFGNIFSLKFNKKPNACFELLHFYFSLSTKDFFFFKKGNFCFERKSKLSLMYFSLFFSSMINAKPKNETQTLVTYDNLVVGCLKNDTFSVSLITGWVGLRKNSEKELCN